MMLSDLLSLLLASIGYAVEITRQMILGYLRLVKYCLIGVLVGSTLAFAGFSAGWISASALMLLLTAEAVVLIVVAIPIDVAIQFAKKLAPELALAIKSYVRFLGLVVLYGVFLSIYFHFVPVPKAATVLVLAVCLGIAIASWLVSMGVGTKFIALRLCILMIIMTLGFFFAEYLPGSTAGAGSLVRLGDKRLSYWMRHVAKPELLEVEYQSKMEKYDDDGDATLWVLKSTDGHWRVFRNGPGHDRITGLAVDPISSEAIAELDRQYNEGLTARQQELEARWAKQRELAAALDSAETSSSSTTSSTFAIATDDHYDPLPSSIRMKQGENDNDIKQGDFSSSTVTTTSSSSTINSLGQEFEIKRAKWRAELEESSRQFNEKMAKYNQEKAEQEEAPTAIGQVLAGAPNLVAGREVARWLGFPHPGEKFELRCIQSLEIDGRLLVKEGKRLTGRVKPIIGDPNRYKLELNLVNGERGVKVETLPLSIGRSRSVGSEEQLFFPVKSVR